jgi:hypothetical protein
MVIVITLLCTTLILLVLISMLYGVYRFMAPVRHDLINKEIHSKVLNELCKILLNEGLGYLITKATEQVKKNEKHN